MLRRCSISVSLVGTAMALLIAASPAFIIRGIWRLLSYVPMLLGDWLMSIWIRQVKLRVRPSGAALWKCQASDGVMWTEYTAGGIGSVAKETCEIAPLVLLAYGSNIWAPPR